MSHEQFTLTRHHVLDLGGIITFPPTLYSMISGRDYIAMAKFLRTPKWESQFLKILPSYEF
jgi:hypothetical protein